MKKVSIALFLMFSITVFCKNETPVLPIDSISKKITYTDKVFVDSATNKQELFSRAREWFAKTYKSSSKVIQMEDKESGKIIGKALMQVYHKGLGMSFESGYINYTFSIYIKDGKYKYEVTDFYHTGQYVGNGKRIADYGTCENMINTTDNDLGFSRQSTYNYYLFQMDNNIKSLIVDLKTAMAVKGEGLNNDNW